jgi:hypothetical protein
MKAGTTPSATPEPDGTYEIAVEATLGADAGTAPP